jgi:hypothetical protein
MRPAANAACRVKGSSSATVRVGLTIGGGSAMVSAMVAIADDGHDVLWAGDAS